ncbi:hypothetical protein VSDG_02479 [Cytospora chrysosperma]|uniref:Uncharacterized protein n=1 Tax=Cytospora chrysosperma TaxID=252740 RepID=A0A423WG19_CYTCH|nr:hypothetical protein VSDG_02479 [Valsa sordida]
MTEAQPRDAGGSDSGFGSQPARRSTAVVESDEMCSAPGRPKVAGVPGREISMPWTGQPPYGIPILDKEFDW